MKIFNNITENNTVNNSIKYDKKQSQNGNNNVNFKGFLNTAGTLMNGIESGGFLASFLIQDTLGMTMPRVLAGFNRDKEVTGKYNKQEGFEVLLREGLTGPLMMAVAPVSFLIAARFGKTTSVNTRLIKRLGNNLNEFITNSNLDKSILKNKSEFKKEFFRLNIKQILENTLGKENVKNEDVKFILEKLTNLNNPPKKVRKGKFRAQILNEITNYINNRKYSTSSELEMLNKVSIGAEGNAKVFSTKDTFDALLKFTDEAVDSNKNFDKLTAEAAENIKNAAVSKRIITNAATIASTLGVMSVIPKIYARNDIAPGARTAMELKEAKNQNVATQDNELNKDANNEVAFKGRGEKGILSRIGKKLSEISKEKFASELEYNGHNFTPTLMASLSLFGLLAPRGKRAYDRAQVDENGKKDLTELWEILIRDVSSSLSVVFAVPLLTKLSVNSYESNSGFVLMHKDRSKTGFKKILDIINPYSSAHVLTNSEIDALYNNIDSQSKMINFCNFIKDNGGDIEKVIRKSEKFNELVKNGDIKLPDLSNLDKNAKNIELTKFFTSLGKDKKLPQKEVDGIITNLMRGSEIKDGAVRNLLKKIGFFKKAKPRFRKEILSFARGLNSIPGLIATFLISPYILGWLIPRATYANTRRIHENRAKEKEAKLNAPA